MIIKIKKRDLIILSLLLLLIIIPIVYADKVTKYFKVSVTVGNKGPVIFYVNRTNVTPTAGGNVTVQVEFNVTDPDGSSDLNDSTVQVNISYGSVTRTSSACNWTDYTTNQTQYICNISFPYYDNVTANWVINVSIMDNAENKTWNNTQNATVLALSSMAIVGNLTFSSVSLGAINQTPDSPIKINNTGNTDFTTQFNITGHDLTGRNDPAYRIMVANFTVNISDAEADLGLRLVNETSLAINGADLYHSVTDGAPINSNRTLYFWLRVPSSGDITPQEYNSTVEWVIIIE